LVVEPVFLSAAHHTSTGIVADVVDVVGVPVEIGDGAVVLTGIEHDQIEQAADAEASPDTEVIVHLDLTDGHPLKVSSDSIHLSLVNRNTAVADERGLGVVELGSAIAVCVVRNLVVVPDRDPRVVLVGGEKIEIGTVGSETLAVVVEGGDDTFGLGDAVDTVAVAVVTVAGVLVNVVTEVDDVVDRVLSYRVSVGVEEAECCLVLVTIRGSDRGWHTEVAARVDSKSNLGSVVIGVRCSLGAAKRTGLVGTADIELVVVASESSEIFGLDLDAQRLANIPNLE
jgi:hypothetical protein